MPKRINVLLAVVLSFAGASTADAANRPVSDGRVTLGETVVWPIMFNEALQPLAPLSEQAVRGGLCPGLVPAADGLIHNYDFDARFKRRGSRNQRWEVTELKLANPSSCAALDAEVTARLQRAIPEFAEPRVDSDGNGWTRIPRIQLKFVE